MISEAELHDLKQTIGVVDANNIVLLVRDSRWKVKRWIGGGQKKTTPSDYFLVSPLLLPASKNKGRPKTCCEVSSTISHMLAPYLALLLRILLTCLICLFFFFVLLKISNKYWLQFINAIHVENNGSRANHVQFILRFSKDGKAK